MAGFVSSGIGSGMDFESIIMASIKGKQQMISRPVTIKKEETNIQITGLGKLRSSLEDFEKAMKSLSDGSAFNQRKVTTDQKENPFFEVSPDKDASNMSHDVIVEQLATSEKVTRDFDTKNGFTNKFQAGTLKISTGKKDDKGKEISFEVKVEEGDSIEVIRRKINENDLGVTANLIKSENGYRLSIDSGKTGVGAKDENLKIEVLDKKGTGDSLDAFAFTTTAQNNWTHEAGKNAIIQLDGQKLESTSNVFEDQISGITLTVNRVSEKQNGGWVSNNFTLTEDTEAVSKKMEEFVNAYNTLQQTMNDLYKHNTYKDGKNQYDGGDLAGDATLKGLQNLLKEKITSFGVSASNAGKTIFDMGIEFTQDGKLEFNKTDFTEALKSNYNTVVGAFSGEKSIVAELEKAVKEYTKSDGILDNKNNQLQAIKKQVEAKEASNEEYLAKYEESLRKKYGALDKLMAGYNNSLSYIQGML